MSKARIYIEDPIQEGAFISLTKDVVHYLTVVLRIKASSKDNIILVFNDRDGEFEAELIAIKKDFKINVIRKIRPVTVFKEIKLYFAPIKQTRLNYMIEKATELGVTDFIPTITERTINRDFNRERYRKIAVEAIEQSERFIIPRFHEQINLLEVVQKEEKIYAAIERQDFRAQENINIANILIGPEGGFSDTEKELLLKSPNIIPVNLGGFILRAETAALVMISKVLN